jgi:hypothetical protein
MLVMAAALCTNVKVMYGLRILTEHGSIAAIGQSQRNGSLAMMLTLND